MLPTALRRKAAGGVTYPAVFETGVQVHLIALGTFALSAGMFAHVQVTNAGTGGAGSMGVPWILGTSVICWSIALLARTQIKQAFQAPHAVA